MLFVFGGNSGLVFLLLLTVVAILFLLFFFAPPCFLLGNSSRLESLLILLGLFCHLSLQLFHGLRPFNLHAGIDFLATRVGHLVVLPLSSSSVDPLKLVLAGVFKLRRVMVSVLRIQDCQQRQRTDARVVFEVVLARQLVNLGFLELQIANSLIQRSVIESAVQFLTQIMGALAERNLLRLVFIEPFGRGCLHLRILLSGKIGSSQRIAYAHLVHSLRLVFDRTQTVLGESILLIYQSLSPTGGLSTLDIHFIGLLAVWTNS